MGSGFLDLKQAAALLHMDALELKHFAQREEVPSQKRGDDFFFDRRLLDEWAQRRMIEISPKQLTYEHSHLDPTISATGEFAEHHRKEDDEGHETQHHQGQHIVEAEHRHQYADHDEDVFDEVDDDIREHHRNAVGVVGDTGDQFSYGNVVELVVRQLFDVLE